MTEKYCPRCKTTKPTTEFARQNRAKSGLQTYCRECNRQLQKQWRQAHPEYKVAMNTRTMLRKYQLSQAEYDELRARQKNRCKICRKVKTLVVDHCHDTNRVRGLLCSSCNTGLGFFYEDTRSLERAIKYLSQ